jgi:hypothetical protein
MKFPANSCIALVCVLISPRWSSAQTPPAPTPPAQTAPAQTPPAQAAPPAPAAAEARPDFSGTWTLDRSISHDPSKASFDPPQGQGNQRPGGFGGGSRRGGRGGIGSGSRPTDRDASNGRTPEERNRLKALTDQLRMASAILVISHHDPSFVINDAQDRTQFFQTDDSTNDHQVGLASISSTTHWEGPRLVTEYALSSRLKLTSTYTLLAATKQMVLRVRLDDTERRRVIGSELKLVYMLGPPASQ